MKTITAKQIADLPIDASTILIRATDEKGKEILGALIAAKCVEGTYGSSKKWCMHGAIHAIVTNGQLAKYLNTEIKQAGDYYGYKCRIEIQNRDGDVLPYTLNGHRTVARKPVRKPVRKTKRV